MEGHETESCRALVQSAPELGQIPKLKEQTETLLNRLCSTPDFPNPTHGSLSSRTLAQRVFEEESLGAHLRLTQFLIKPKQLDPESKSIPFDMRPIHVLTLNQKPILFSQLVRGVDRDFTVAYVLNSKKKWIPRFLYRSLSDGSWRSAPEVFVEGSGEEHGSQTTYSKGMNIHYTQETKVLPEVVHYLEGLEVDRFLKPGERTRIEHAFFEESKVNLKAKKEWQQDIRSYEREIQIFNDSGILFRVQLCQPGECFKSPPSEGTHRDQILELNRQFATPGMKAFVPDFSKAPEREYYFSHSLLSAYGSTPTRVPDIHVRVFPGMLRGKKVEWHMAQDPKGRTWIDRIRLADQAMSPYLTDSIVINSGILTNKPLEHRHQAIGLIPHSEYHDFDYSYVDITPLLEHLAPIRAFKTNYPLPSKNPALTLSPQVKRPAPSWNPWTPLMSAAWNGDLKAIQSLGEKGVDLEVQSPEGFTALHLAARNSQFQAVKLLLKLGANPKANEALAKPSLWQAVFGTEKTEVIQKYVRELSRSNPKVSLTLRDLDEITLLARATLKNDLKLVELLVQEGAEIEWVENGTRKSWIPFAAANQDTRILEFLLSKVGKSDAILQVSSFGESIGHIAAHENHPKLIPVLKKLGANLNAIDSAGESPLILALATSQYEVAEALIDAGVDVNQPELSGNTPLHFACAGGNLKVIQALLKKGAKPIPNHDGIEPTSLLLKDMPPQNRAEALRLLQSK